MQKIFTIIQPTSLGNKTPKKPGTEETINKTKRQPTEWEKIFANDATN